MSKAQQTGRWRKSSAHSVNIVNLLRMREEDCAYGNSVNMGSSLCRRCVPLSAIMDRNNILMQGHVILGFSRSGQYLISYQCTLSGQFAQGEHCYSLHWWRFQLFRPVEHLFSYSLFPGEVFERELHIIVAQTDDEQHVIVQGCMRSLKSENIRTCHTAILPSPNAQMEQPWTAIQVKFDLLPPFPPLLPYLALRIPGCVVLNTGDRLVALVYETDQPLTPLDSPGSMAYSWLHNQTYSLHSDVGPDTPVSSPSQLLPVELFHGETQMVLQCSHIKDSGSAVQIGQSILDIEVWANQTLYSELEVMGFNYHCLLDYDLQIVEVNGDRGEVVFVLVTLVEVLDPSGTIDSYSLEVVGLWSVFSGVTEVKQIHPPTLIPGPSHSPIPISASTIANTLRKLCFLPSHPQKTIRAFSNHTVHTGKSLQCINHPQLPVSIILRRNTSPQL